METYLIYIGKSAIAAGAFYIAFLLLFQNQKHFTFNRIYLPVSLALSFVIPLITFTTVKYIEPSNFDANSFAYLAPGSEEIVQSAFVFEWYHNLFGLYLLGTAGFLFHLLLGHFKAINIIQKSRIQKIFGNLVNITQKDIHPFSFFSKIVVSEKTLSHPDLEIIVSHENIHVREKHTFDILFTEIMFLLQWFNPFAWLIKDAVKNNLEYKTDDEIVKKYNPQTYQLAMVTLADKQGIAPFLTALNGSQLKNRIIMMKKKKEKKYAILKQLAVLPLLAVLIMGLANREVKTENIQSDKKTDLVIDGKSIPTDHPALPSVDNQKKFDSGEIATLMNVGDKVISTTMVIDDSFTTSEKEFMVSGKVTDNKGQPLSGVSILIKGKTLETTTTDTKGIYEIKSESEIELLVFGKNGYETLEVKPSGRKNIDVKLEVDNKLYIVDGKAYEGEMSEINADNIESIDIFKGESGFKLYGENGKNGVVLITTKSKEKIGAQSIFGNEQVPELRMPVAGDSLNLKMPIAVTDPQFQYYIKEKQIDYVNPLDKNSKVQPLILVNGKEPGQTIEDINPGTIQSVNVLKEKSAKEKYGEKGKNGVIEITLKNAGTNNEINTILAFRQSIAKQIKYPVEAQENNQQGAVEIWAYIEKDGTISRISEKRPDGKFINIDEVVATSLKSEKTVTSEKSKDLALLIKESKRVIEQLSPLSIPELAGETVSFRIRFVLQ